MEKIPVTLAKKGETGEESDEEHAGRLHRHPYHREFVLHRARLSMRSSNEAIDG